MTTNSNCNILVIGDSGVGKTSFITNNFTEKSTSYTLGVNYYYKNIQLSNGNKIVLKVIDTDGNIDTNSISFKNACITVNGVIIVYDITNKTSFDNVSKWLIKIQKYKIMDDTIIYLIGNKSDLIKSDLNKREVSSEDAIKWTKENLEIYKPSIYETSVKVNSIDHIFNSIKETSVKVNSIDIIFNDIAKQIKDHKQKPRPEPSCCSIS
jgi:small GTP-binding protein